MHRCRGSRKEKGREGKDAGVNLGWDGMQKSGSINDAGDGFGVASAPSRVSTSTVKQTRHRHGLGQEEKEEEPGNKRTAKRVAKLADAA